MTRDRAKDILIHAGPQVLYNYCPVGISFNDVVADVLQVAHDEELDLIAKHFGIIRQLGTGPFPGGMGFTDPETDACFRDRLLSDFLPAQPKIKTHVHSWKLYQGFTETYDYCEGCDEKRRK